MSLIAIAVYDTVDNKRTEFTKRTLTSLAMTVDDKKHRLFVVDNNSCEATKSFLDRFDLFPLTVITLSENIGTARAINKAWAQRNKGEHCVKMDNDVVIHQNGWLDKLEECIARDPKIGIIGLKRKDLFEDAHATKYALEHPYDKSEKCRHARDWQAECVALPHEPGQTWLTIEKVNHVMGTCQLYNSALLDKIGYLYQMGLIYGLDDSLAAARCKAAGFYNCFYPHIDIDHIDPGGCAYTQWKRDYANPTIGPFCKLRDEILQGAKGYYYGPEDK